MNRDLNSFLKPVASSNRNVLFAPQQRQSDLPH